MILFLFPSRLFDESKKRRSPTSARVGIKMEGFRYTAERLREGGAGALRVSNPVPFAPRNTPGRKQGMSKHKGQV
jgi:hypothetical protein